MIIRRIHIIIVMIFSILFTGCSLVEAPDNNQETNENILTPIDQSDFETIHLLLNGTFESFCAEYGLSGENGNTATWLYCGYVLEIGVPDTSYFIGFFDIPGPKSIPKAIRIEGPILGIELFTAFEDIKNELGATETYYSYYGVDRSQKRNHMRYQMDGLIVEFVSSGDEAIYTEVFVYIDTHEDIDINFSKEISSFTIEDLELLLTTSKRELLDMYGEHATTNTEFSHVFEKQYEVLAMSGVPFDLMYEELQELPSVLRVVDMSYGNFLGLVLRGDFNDLQTIWGRIDVQCDFYNVQDGFWYYSAKYELDAITLLFGSGFTLLEPSEVEEGDLIINEIYIVNGVLS